jgi:Flp pilus assembly protein TadD
MLKRKGIQLLAVALLALYSVVAIDGQVFIPPGAVETGLGGANAITGMVLHPGGRLERRIAVRLQSMTKGDRTAMTDENGNFAFRGLASGDYTIVIDKEKEFEPFSQSVTIVQMRGAPPGTYMVNVRLTLKSSPDGKPGVVDSRLGTVPKDARDLFAKGLELAKNRDFRGAIEQLNLAIAAHPTFMLAFNELGVQYLRLGELDKADAALVTAIKLEPEAFEPLMNRGIVLVTAKKYADAEPVIRKALAIKEQSPVAHYFLGQALAYVGNFDAAEKELRIAVETGGEQMKEAHRLLAIIYSSRGDKKRAAAEIETYLKLAPQAPDAEQLRRVARQLRGLEAAPATPASNTKPNQ